MPHTNQHIVLLSCRMGLLVLLPRLDPDGLNQIMFSMQVINSQSDRKKLTVTLLRVNPVARLGLAFFLLTLLGCSGKETAAQNIQGRWTLSEVVYEDGTTKTLGDGNAVVFEPLAIVEVIEGLGKRRYPYSLNKDTLLLKVGNEQVVWKVVEQKIDSLKINTPIGLYVLIQ